MNEKSALDTINEMHIMMKDLHSKMDLMTKSINILQNKINGIDTPNVMKIQAPSISNIDNDLDISQKKIGVPLLSNKVRIFGTVYNEKKPVFGVQIKINDANNKVVKNTKTDISGNWEMSLPQGKYSIKYVKSGMPPSYRIVEIKEGQREIEIV